MLPTYDPALVIMVLGTIPITGIADGTFIEIERDEDQFTKYVGAGGEVSRARVRNRAGKCTFTLASTSPSNDLLEALARQDETDNSGVSTLLIKDGTGTTLVHAQNAWVMKRPKVEYGKEIGTRAWVIDVADLDVFVGGTVG